MLLAILVVGAATSVPALPSPHRILGDLVVGGNETRVVDRDIVVQGSIIIKDNGTLVVTGARVEVLQYSANEHDISVSGYGTLRLTDGVVFSDRPMDASFQGSAELEVVSSTMDTAGGNITVSGSSAVFTLSTLRASRTSISASFDISGSEFTPGAVTLASSGTVSNTTVQGTLIVVSPGVRMVNSRADSLDVQGGGEVRIYHRVYVEVVDRIGTPIDGAKVSLARYPSGTLVEERWSSKGYVLFEPLSDIVVAAGPEYLGNYTLTAGYSGETTSVPLVLPHFRPHTPAGPYIPVRMGMDVSAGYVGTPRDMVISGVERVIHGDGNLSLQVQGNLVVRDGGRLVLLGGARLLMDQSLGRTRVSIESGTIELHGSSRIESVQPLGVYIDSGTLVAENGSIAGSVAGTGTSRILLTNTTLTGILAGGFENVSLMGSSVAGVNVTSTSVYISGSTVAGNASISTGSISMRDLDVKGALTLSGPGTVSACSLRYGDIVILPPTVELRRSWHVDVEVTNGNERPVPDAEVRVYNFTVPASAIASARTDVNGRAGMDLLGEVVTRSGAVFAGNYLIEVSFERSGALHNRTVTHAVRGDTTIPFRFPEKVIPPLGVGVQARIEPPGDIHPGDAFTVRGQVTYDGGPDPVPGAEVSLLLLENGKEVFNVTTDTRGIFAQVMNAPLLEGDYTIEVHIYDPATGFTNVTHLTLQVRRASMVAYIPWAVISAVLVVTVLLALLLQGRARRMRMRRESARMGLDEMLALELERMRGEKRGGGSRGLLRGFRRSRGDRKISKPEGR